MTLLTNRCTLITGASSGIGRETALAFAEAGANLVLIGRSADRLEEVATKARQQGVEVNTYSLDLAQVEQVREAIAQIAARHPIDILVNNAGMGYTGALAEMPLADWQAVLNLNLTSVLLCIQAVLPGMRDRQQGTIINIASIAGYASFPDWGAYSVSKAGLISLSKILAAEERPHGVRVVVISPGSVNTPIWDTDTVQADFDRSKMLTPDVVAQSILHAASLPSHAVIQELTVMPSGGAL
ncbi:SDR family oxidoreductase [Oscillatoria sp. FACHB-1407]|uniref:SDR family oxidoreductase n=1 Tax=Oscillatoria sp. FACHB-1407 TaxID=2692847 RepID=UPI001687194D|nr:SDR family oxidoreductase [Oscillatoria sp. FACHB-1407]MBD2464541.1 SDR family oxidoreductase [Oscillatoria sp. FACHB-1407]